MTQRFDRLPNESGLFMQVWAENFLGALETALTDIETVNAAQTAQLALIEAAQADLAAQLLLIQAAQADADAANADILVQQKYEKTRDSEADGTPLSAEDVGADCTIFVAAHDRNYLAEAAVPVSAGSITGLAFSTLYYVYYEDPTFAGGAVTFLATTEQSDAVSSLTNPTRHVIGSVTTPADGGAPSVGTSGPPPWKFE